VGIREAMVLEELSATVGDVWELSDYWIVGLLD
jgi:hypothetical protein